MPTLTAPLQIENLFLIAYAEHPDDRDPTRRTSLSLDLDWAPSSSAAARRNGSAHASTLNPGLPFSAHGVRVELDRASGEVRVSGRGAALPGAVEEAAYWVCAPAVQRIAGWARARLTLIPGAHYVGYHHNTLRDTNSISLGFLPEGEVTLEAGAIRFHEYSHSFGNPIVEAAVGELAGLLRDLPGLVPLEIAPRR